MSIERHEVGASECCGAVGVEIAERQSRGESCVGADSPARQSEDEECILVAADAFGQLFDEEAQVLVEREVDVLLFGRLYRVGRGFGCLDGEL